MPEISRSDIELWIQNVPTGEFHYKAVKDGNIDPSCYGRLRQIMHDICKADKPICESVGRKDGYYRAIDEMPEAVDWQSVDATKDFPIILPFDLRKYVWIDNDTTVVVAGSKDSGKTGFIMRTVAMNMHFVNTVFLTNMEGGVNQLKRRFDAMDIEIERPAPFKVHYMIDNFHDAIKEPDTLYLIDYIDVPESGEFYMIAGAIAKIQVKLRNSVAVIGLQKRFSSDWAYGGEQTKKKPALYLAMNPGKLKIVSAKVHANPKIDPTNMQWTFDYNEQGTRFSNIARWEGE